MIKVLVKTNTARMEVIAEVTDTPAAIFEQQGISTAGSTANLNGGVLTKTELHSAFQSLGVSDGETVSLNSIIKADGAR